MALLKDFLSGLNFPPVTFLKQRLESRIREDVEPLKHCTPTDWCLKSGSKSIELRGLGNLACNTKDYEAALKYYSRSIANAPTDSEELALAYGNRSAVLQVQKEYELFLLDTNRALDGSIPQSSRMTLLERKAMCWEKLQEQNVMRTKLREDLSNLKCISSLERGNLMACERQLCYISKVDIDDTDLVIHRSLIDDPAWETKFENEICENLSPKVQQRVDKEWGQVFVAADDIEAGEILSSDDFYALVVNESDQQEYCSHCSVRCKALIPCLSCTEDMYCCVGCRQEAYDTYHETECKILPLWGNVSPLSSRQGRRLVLRVFLTGTGQGAELTTLLNDPRVYAAMNGNLDYARTRYTSKDYLPLLSRLWKLDIVNQRMRIKVAFEIITCLRYVRFFGADGGMKTQCSGNILTGEELLAAVLLAHNFPLSIPRCHHIFAYFYDTDEGGTVMKRRSIGAAVGPWHTFLNHSCAPNVIRLNNGQRVLFRSLRPIKAGELISIGNGKFYNSDIRKDRQAYFKQLWGRECSCIACVENWPLISELMLSRNKYLTSNREVVKKIEKMQNWLFTKANS